MADLQEKLREQKQRTREHEEALRSAGGAGKSGETPSVEASAQIDSKVDQKKLCPCLSSNVSSHIFMYVEQWLLSMPSTFPLPHFPLLLRLFSSFLPILSLPFPSFPCPCISPPPLLLLLHLSSPFLSSPPSSPSFPPLLLPTYTAPLC